MCKAKIKNPRCTKLQSPKSLKLPKTLTSRISIRCSIYSPQAISPSNPTDLKILLVCSRLLRNPQCHLWWTLTAGPSKEVWTSTWPILEPCNRGKPAASPSPRALCLLLARKRRSLQLRTWFDVQYIYRVIIYYKSTLGLRLIGNISALLLF